MENKFLAGINKKCYKILPTIILVCLMIPIIYPLFWMLISSFRPGAQIASYPLAIDIGSWSMKNYEALFSIIPIGRAFKNTFIVLLIKGGLAMFFSPLAGFTFAKLKFPGKKVLFTIVLISVMLPPIVLMIPLLIEMGSLRLLNTYSALILPGAIGGFYIFWMRQQIAGIPDDLLDAARIDGLGEFGIYIRIIIPLIKSGLGALAIIVGLDIYNDFVWPVIAISSNEMQTVQIMMSSLYDQINNIQVGTAGASAWGIAMAASIVVTLPILLLFIFSQRHFKAGILAGSLKS